MNLSHAYGVPPAPEAAAGLLLRALDLGVNHFDTAALYGFGANEELVGQVLAPHRHRFTLASKCGMTGVDGRRVIDGRPATLKATCEAALRRLRTEYSLWTRNPEIAVLDACRELDVAFVAFSPLARGFLPGTLRDVSGFDAKDIRRAMPRFTASNHAANLRLLEPLVAVAEEAGCTLAQLALAWLLHRGDHILPIPGTTSVAHLEENLGAAAVTLTPAQMARLEAAIHPGNVAGARYNGATQTEIDTEEFPA